MDYIVRFNNKWIFGGDGTNYFKAQKIISEISDKLKGRADIELSGIAEIHLSAKDNTLSEKEIIEVATSICLIVVPDAPKDLFKVIADGVSLNENPIICSETADSKFEEDTTPSTIGLSEEIDKIERLKLSMLDSIRGQNYAISVVTESVFEADLFAANNPERKTPLLSLFFLGPSGVGKTLMASSLGKILNKEILTVDMSFFGSDNIRSIADFTKKHNDGIIIFDEFEKASPNAHNLFLQILDEARLDDISFRDNIIIITSNAGRSLYESNNSYNLSSTSKRVILEALRTDINPMTGAPYFPECITTRFANGHVILFNHLEPYALMQIISDEISLQIDIFKKATGIDVKYNAKQLAATVLYSAGGVSDARTLRGTAKNIIVKELYDSLSLAHKNCNEINTIHFAVDSFNVEINVKSLYSIEQPTVSLVLSDKLDNNFILELSKGNHKFISVFEITEFKKQLGNIVDYVIIDPFFGKKEMENIPSDIEDYKSDGIDLIFYLIENNPDIPVYILNSENFAHKKFSTLLEKGVKGIVDYNPNTKDEFEKAVDELTYCSLINNSAFSLTRSNKCLTYNCAQYISEGNLVISFERLMLKQTPSSADSNTLFFGSTDSGESFEDVVGCKAAKEAMQDICDCVKNQREYMLSGKKVPKGILLYGRPGTGKTMLARALANEVGAAFLPTTATSFFNKYVGQTEENIRNLFATAKRYAPSIIFIDEVDAIAKERSGDAVSQHNGDALTTFLSQMDGFIQDSKRPVFVVAATNYSIDGSTGPKLDEAFIRRFDRRVYFDFPTTSDRYDLFKVLLEKHNIDFEKDQESILKNLASRSGGMSNADIVSMVDSFIRSIRDENPTAAAIMDAMDHFRFGEVKSFNPETVKQTAYHEAGHALIYRLLSGTPSYLTIVSRGNFGGYMEHANDSDKSTYTYAELLNRICTSLAGRASEILVYGEELGNNTGASSDIESARNVLSNALKHYAMGEKLFQEATPEDCEKIMQDQYTRTFELLRSNRSILDSLAELLFNEKSIDQTALEKFFNEVGI